MLHKSKIKIAIIEDDAPIRDMYELKLKKEGYIVKTADNGVTGLKLIEEFRPNLILLDLLMPEMSGDEMLEKLREHDWARSIKVIILTNVSSNEVSYKLRLLKIDKYIVKVQYTPQQVIDIVEEVLDKL